MSIYVGNFSYEVTQDALTAVFADNPGSKRSCLQVGAFLIAGAPTSTHQ